MIKLFDYPVQYTGKELSKAEENRNGLGIAEGILRAHGGKGEALNIGFDALCSHDITYVGIIQTAKASGLKRFPLPYVLTNCHNSLCAVGGTINEDDHVFGLSAAKKYGGIFVPPHVAVIHEYMREQMAFCGGMILGSDSHTRYGALGTMGIGEGGPELVKQLLGRTYDINFPKIIAVNIKGKLRPGVGPQDVALTLISKVYKSGFVKNAVLEFVGTGISALSVDERNGIDVMTTETSCLSSVWETDEKVRDYYKLFGREDMFNALTAVGASYDAGIEIDLSDVEPMIALPYHPSNAVAIRELLANPKEVLEARAPFLLNKIDKQNRIHIDQGVIAGCAGGTYENIAIASQILQKGKMGSGEFSLSVYPSSLPVYSALMRSGYLEKLISSGVVVKTAFCGPCFGAGDVPCNGGLSVRHTTRNFENREGSRPQDGQEAFVALMDARSVAATAANGGILTSALDLTCDAVLPFIYDASIYENRVNSEFDENTQLVYGPNITDWPKFEPLKDNLLIEMAAALKDDVTTTDELIPSGETSSYRSNPLKLSSFALSRKYPTYVANAKRISQKTKAGLSEVLAALKVSGEFTFGSGISGISVGDGSAREQAASCQRVLGGVANIVASYATKRYRSNLINWGLVPLLGDEEFFEGDYVYIEGVLSGLKTGVLPARLLRDGKVREITLKISPITDAEYDIIKAGCLINYYGKHF